MQFISYSFLAFFPIVVLVSYLLPKRARRFWLLFSGYWFYMCVRPVMGIYLLLITAVTYAAGRLMERCPADSEKTEGKRRVILVVTLLLSIGLLGVLKYSGMAADTVSGLLSLSGSSVTVPKPDILLPAGISFYLLQALGYVIDVYRGDLAAEHDLLNYALFVSFFPQVLSGPIERAGRMLPQFADPPAFSYENMRAGLLRMLWGFFLKLVLADRLAIVVDTVYGSPDAYSGSVLAIAALLYTFQIYCDFDGYTSIAIGAARVLGFRVMENFDAPYLAGSVADFWRRWHRSLSYWFRDYLYIPLGGNRKGVFRKYVNILIVFTVSGLWHGAGWTFVFWGLLHGIYQVIGYLLRPVRNFFVRILHVDRNSFSHRLLKVIITFSLVSFAWIFFRAPDMAAALRVARSSLRFRPWELTGGTLLTLGLDGANIALLLICLAVRIAVDLCSFHGIRLSEKLVNQEIWLRWTVYLAAVAFILLCGIWGPGYNAASFIYAQF